MSFADHPSTSRRISTARCLGGRCWIAAMKASSIVSLATTTAPGSSSAGAIGSSSRSGYGCSHGRSAGGEGGAAGSPAAATCVRQHPARPAAQHVEARVRRDPVEPGPERGALRRRRSSRACATRAGRSPGRDPRSPRTSRASDSSGPAAPARWRSKSAANAVSSRGSVSCSAELITGYDRAPGEKLIAAARLLRLRGLRDADRGGAQHPVGAGDVAPGDRQRSAR